MASITKLSRITLILISLALVVNINAQNVNRITENDYVRKNNRRVMHIPDIQDFTTLKGDFHMHTMFSDGQVWPEVRVNEAWREGLDVIAITDHIEYLPHKDYLISDHNTPYEVAKSKALNQNIILIHATEITRSMPPGHLNALFLDDVNLLEHKNPMKQLEEASKQGAFVLWNHPGWASQQPDTTKWWDMHSTALENGWLHGVEVCNSGNWYPIALDWCKEYKLTAFANTDIHDPIDFKYNLNLENSHRPMTLIFAKERSEEGVKEALFSRRTLGFFGNQLMGPDDLITDLFYASVIVNPAFMESESDGEPVKHIELENPTDLTFILSKNGKDETIIDLSPHSIVIINIPANADPQEYQLLNCWSGSNEHPVVSF